MIILLTFKFMKYLLLVILMIFANGILCSQTVTGRITYKSSQNIYVRFESTQNISIGDTLYVEKENILTPVLVVLNLSSTSCVCSAIYPDVLALSLQIIAKAKNISTATNKDVSEIKVQPTKDTTTQTTNKPETPKEFIQKIYGNISASSSSNFSNTGFANSNRFQYGLSLNAQHIDDSRFSLETNISFWYDNSQWSIVKSDIYQALKIYSLSVKYDIDKNTQLSVGRRTNPNLANIGAIDGIQYEKKIDNFSFGVFLGSRPSYVDYRTDFNLLEYGAYLAHNYKNLTGTMQNSFAIAEQMNAFKTDRRFAYIQHNNTLIKKLYVFYTMEVELYNNTNGVSQTTFSPSSTYFSLTYKLFDKITLSTNYDSRKNVMYYETYKSFINQIIEMQARQGVSFQANYYSMKNFSAGFKTGYSFPNSTTSASKNIYGYVTYSNLPLFNINTTLASTYLETSYTKGKIITLNFSRSFLKSNLYSECGYQHVVYGYFGNENSTIQNIANLSISWRFKNLSFSTNFEESFENKDRYEHLILQIRKRF